MTAPSHQEALLSQALERLAESCSSVGKLWLIGTDDERRIAPIKDKADAVSRGPITDIATLRSPFDLIIVVDQLDVGCLADIGDRLATLVTVLAPAGRILMVLPCLAAGDRQDDVTITGHDALLFPMLAGTGVLGSNARDRSRLGASTWLLLMQSVGLTVVSVVGVGQTTLPADLVRAHSGRLNFLSSEELATDHIVVLAQRTSNAT